MLDGDIVRRLDVGQVAYVYRGGVTFLQIKRLTGKQAAIGRGTAWTTAAGAAGGAQGATGSAGRLGASEPPTTPLPVIGTAPAPSASFSATGHPAGLRHSSGPPWRPAPWSTSGIPGGAPPGAALPDVSEVLDDAFGARHD